MQQQYLQQQYLQQQYLMCSILYTLLINQTNNVDKLINANIVAYIVALISIHCLLLALLVENTKCPHLVPPGHANVVHPVTPWFKLGQCPGDVALT